MKEKIKTTLAGMPAKDKLIYISGKMLSTSNKLKEKEKEFGKNLQGATLDCANGKSCLGFLDNVDNDIMEMEIYIQRIKNLAELSRAYSVELETAEKIVGEQLKLMEKSK